MEVSWQGRQSNMRIDRRLASHFDWPIFGLAIGLVLIGVLTIYSATRDLSGNGVSPLTLRQLYWLIIGVTLVVGTFTFDYHLFERYAYAFYGGVLLLLVLVLFYGVVSGGSQRWLNLGFFSLQPSELAKLAIVVVLAKALQEDEPVGGYRLRDLWIPFVLAAPLFFLILVQPDLGTAVIYFLIFFTVILMGVLHIRSLLLLGLGGVALLPIGWLFLKPYQQARLQVFLSPDLDRLGTGYHVIQSKIAIGSGRLFGTGYLGGTQNRLDFLPAQHTDFVFSVFAEEWGFFGCVFLLGLYLALILLAFRVVTRAKDRLGALLAFGAIAIIVWPAMLNVAMVTGVLPVAGIPLPFLSYGGSSLVVTMVAVGIIINVSMRRFTF